MDTDSGFTATFSRHEATPMIGSTIVMPLLRRQTESDRSVNANSVNTDINQRR